MPNVRDSGRKTKAGKPIYEAIPQETVVKTTYTGQGDTRFREYSSGRIEQVSGNSASGNLSTSTVYDPYTQIQNTFYTTDAQGNKVLKEGVTENQYNEALAVAVKSGNIPVSNEQYTQITSQLEKYRTEKAKQEAQAKAQLEAQVKQKQAQEQAKQVQEYIYSSQSPLRSNVNNAPSIEGVSVTRQKNPSETIDKTGSPNFKTDTYSGATVREIGAFEFGLGNGKPKTESQTTAESLKSAITDFTASKQSNYNLAEVTAIGSGIAKGFINAGEYIAKSNTISLVTDPVGSAKYQYENVIEPLTILFTPNNPLDVAISQAKAGQGEPIIEVASTLGFIELGTRASIKGAEKVAKLGGKVEDPLILKFESTDTNLKQVVGRSKSTGKVEGVKTEGAITTSTSPEVLINKVTEKTKEPVLKVEGFIVGGEKGLQKVGKTSVTRVRDTTYSAIEIGDTRINLETTPTEVRQTIYDLQTGKKLSETRSPNLELNNVPLSYYRYGEGEPLVQEKKLIEGEGEAFRDITIYDRGKLSGSQTNTKGINTRINIEVKRDTSIKQQTKAQGFSLSKQDVTGTFKVTKELEGQTTKTTKLASKRKVVKPLPNMKFAEETQLIPTQTTTRDLGTITQTTKQNLNLKSLPSATQTVTVERTLTVTKRVEPAPIISSNIVETETTLKGEIVIGEPVKQIGYNKQTNTKSAKVIEAQKQTPTIKPNDLSNLKSTSVKFDNGFNQNDLTLRNDEKAVISEGSFNGLVLADEVKVVEKTNPIQENTVYIAKENPPTTKPKTPSFVSTLSNVDYGIVPTTEPSGLGSTSSLGSLKGGSISQTPSLNFSLARNNALNNAKAQNNATKSAQAQERTPITENNLRVDISNRIDISNKVNQRNEINNKIEIDTTNKMITEPVNTVFLENVKNPRNDRVPPPIPKEPKPPKPTGLSFPKPKQEKKNEEAFKVSVRKGGKFQSIGVFGSQETAFKVGETVTRQTARASFKVEPLGFIKGSTQNTPKGFYSSRKESGVFIQKRENRISSIGEKREITFKGIATLKQNKNRKKSIFG